jgi:hypothetical protein
LPSADIFFLNDTGLKYFPLEELKQSTTGIRKAHILFKYPIEQVENSTTAFRITLLKEGLFY